MVLPEEKHLHTHPEYCNLISPGPIYSSCLYSFPVFFLSLFKILFICKFARPINSVMCAICALNCEVQILSDTTVSAVQATMGNTLRCTAVQMLESADHGEPCIM